MKQKTEAFLMGLLFTLVPASIAGGLVSLVSPWSGTFVFIFFLFLGLDVCFRGKN